MGLADDRVLGIKLGGLIYDVGKMAIPAELLIASRRLTEPEMAIVRTHPEVGARIVREIEFPWPIANMILQHHERMDGSGYPAKLKNGDILLEARIIGVADVVEAMASHRPHRPKLGIPAALEEIREKRGILYDPDVVDACERVIERSGRSLWEHKPSSTPGVVPPHRPRGTALPS
jgi:HD-GYP domain-containing protein (c-di-GMP phosphodiesterase class II)